MTSMTICQRKLFKVEKVIGFCANADYVTLVKKEEWEIMMLEQNKLMD
jgi:hypothetical protein